MTSAEILHQVKEERERQILKWGQQDHSDPEWTAILTEEVGESAQETLNVVRAKTPVQLESSVRRLRSELIQVAAVAVAWIEAIDRRIIK